MKNLKILILISLFTNLLCMGEQDSMQLKVALAVSQKNHHSFEILEPSKQFLQGESELFRYPSYGTVFSGDQVIFIDLKETAYTYDPYLSMLLYGAALKGQLEVVRKILKAPNVNVNYHADVQGNTPLIAAIKSGHIEIAKLLLQHPKINLLISNLKHITPLLATKGRRPHTEIIKLILEAGDFWNYFLYQDHQSILTKAVINANLEIVKIIASKWPKFINIKDDKGKTPLDHAQEQMHIWGPETMEEKKEIFNFLENASKKVIL